MASRVIWHRRQKSSHRRTTPIEVDDVGRTPSGNIVIEYMHRYRKIRKLVKQSNLEIVEDD